MNTIIWEYHVLQNPVPSQLAALGQQGWELVSVTSYTTGFAGAEKAYFKRPNLTTTTGVVSDGK